MRCSFDWLAGLLRATGSAAVLLSVSMAVGAEEEKVFTQQPEILQSRQGQEVVGEPPAAAKPVVSNEVFNQGTVAQWIWGADQKQN